jgi:hypothetical protein
MTTHEGITIPIRLAITQETKAFFDMLKTLHSDEAVVPPSAKTEAATQTTTTPPAPGEIWPGQGGYFICTLPAINDLPARHLIIGTAEKDGLEYGPRKEVTGAGSHTNGATNTSALMASSDAHPAAAWAKNYSADGHADFFLPSRLDMLMAYFYAPQLFNKDGYYWTSTQLSSDGAFVQGFEDGSSSWGCKGYEHRVRAARVIPL